MYDLWGVCKCVCVCVCARAHTHADLTSESPGHAKGRGKGDGWGQEDLVPGHKPASRAVPSLMTTRLRPRGRQAQTNSQPRHAAQTCQQPGPGSP